MGWGEVLHLQPDENTNITIYHKINLHFRPNTNYCVNMKAHEHEKNHSPIDAVDV